MPLLSSPPLSSSSNIWLSPCRKSCFPKSRSSRRLPPLRRTQPAQRPPVSTAATTGEGAGGEQGDVAAKRNVPKDLSTDWESDWIDDDAGLFWADPGGDESFAQDGMEEGAAFAGEPDAWPGLALTSAGGRVLLPEGKAGIMRHLPGIIRRRPL